MKKILSGIIALFALAILAVPALADVNAVTPSTNDINRTNGWAHVDQLSQGVGTTDLKFISTRNFASCFEYRTDGDTSQASGANYNPSVTDGLYPFHCENNSSHTYTIHANNYVEVRMVFGAETDERFDWTRFDVLQPPVPTNKDDCKKDGWENYVDANGNAFKNQGQCVSFVASQKLVDTFSVDSSSVNGTDSNVTLKLNKNYRFEVSGTWTNSLNVADAEYASTDNWSNHFDGYNTTPWNLGEGEFDVQVDNAFVNWGPYDSGHDYNYYMTGTGSTANFRVFDGDSNSGPTAVVPGWYGDNNGSLTVKVYEVK